MKFIGIGVEKKILRKVLGQRIPGLPNPRSMYGVRYPKAAATEGSIGYFGGGKGLDTANEDFVVLATTKITLKNLWPKLLSHPGDLYRHECLRGWIRWECGCITHVQYRRIARKGNSLDMRCNFCDKAHYVREARSHVDYCPKHARQ